jgi:hypothetical protein
MRPNPAHTAHPLTHTTSPSPSQSARTLLSELTPPHSLDLPARTDTPPLPSPIDGAHHTHTHTHTSVQYSHRGVRRGEGGEVAPASHPSRRSSRVARAPPPPPDFSAPPSLPVEQRRALKIADLDVPETDAERAEVLAWIRIKTQVRAPFELNLNDSRFEGKTRQFFDGTIVDFSGKSKQEPWLRVHVRWEDGVVTKHHNVQVQLWVTDWVNYSLRPPPPPPPPSGGGGGGLV